MKIEKIENKEHGVLVWILLYDPEKKEKIVEENKKLFLEEVKEYDKLGVFLSPEKILDENSDYKITELAQALGKASYFLSMPDNPKGEDVVAGLRKVLDDFWENNFVNIRDRAKEELIAQGIKPESDLDAEFDGAVDWRMQKKLEPFIKLDAQYFMEDFTLV